MSKIRDLLNNISTSSNQSITEMKYELNTIDNEPIVNLWKTVKEYLNTIGMAFSNDNIVRNNVILVLSKPNFSVDIPLEFDMFSNNGRVKMLSPDYFLRLAERNGFKTFSIKIDTPKE